jgi:small GTP-binding protein
MPYSTAQIRNVALAGHPGAGKTTLFEALLQAGGALQTAGSVERGTTVSDHDPMEKSRGHSLDSAIASLDHDGIHVNLIDTPGYPDFRGPTLSALAAVETVAALAVDVRAARTRLWWSQAKLAEQAGVSRYTVSRLEAGSSWPDLQPLLRICAVLDLTLKIVPRA